MTAIIVIACIVTIVCESIMLLDKLGFKMGWVRKLFNKAKKPSK